MAGVTIDPGSLAVPDAQASGDDARSYAEFIVSWSILLRERWADVFVSERAAAVLFEAGLYPMRPELHRLFSANGVIDFDVNTVGRVAETLLGRTPSFEEYFGIKDVLASDTKTEPEILSRYSSQALNEELERELVLSALLGTVYLPLKGDHRFALRGLEGSVVVKLSTVIHELEYAFSRPQGPASPPTRFKGAVSACGSLEEVVTGIEPSQIWAGTSDATDLASAVGLSLYKHQIESGTGPDPRGLHPYRIGEKLPSTAAACCQSGPNRLNSKVLEAIVETVYALSLNKVHRLRTGKGGNDPPVTRGADVAWRRDIDYEYHLHYWACSDGTVEIASVVVHGDYSIPR